MDSQSAKNLVIETFENGFDKAVFLNFIRNLVKKFDESKAFHARGHVKHKFKKTTPVIKTYERLGTYIDSEEKTTDILIVYLNKDNSIEARSSLRNFVADYLKQRDSKDSALVAFVPPQTDDWRFSLIKMEYQLEQTARGQLHARTKLTPAKRFSFLVGKNENSYTAKKQFLPLLTDDQQPLLSEFESAFNVEKVTKEFFAKYRELYDQLKESLDDLVKLDERIKKDFVDKNIDTVDFAKKLLGQIVFLYFLQKKGWFGVERDKDWGTGSKKFLRELFEGNHGPYKNFFNDILEHLFYQALRNDRSYDDHYFGKFDCKIPFLNGGLFDPINDYEWIKTDILLPNSLFSNNHPTKEGDIGDGILDIFDRYNFTVKEDEPLEKEVAIDPEMLGKVFENLLAVKDRKSKGTYYTPREIVHYMCQQSLINYLATELKNKVNQKDIATLIKYGETTVEHDKEASVKEKTAFKLPKDVIKSAQLIDDKLADIRVCDPAVGSGAFLVGMMSEVVKARNALTSHLKNKENRSPYYFKRQAIEKSLYGVDIDLGAVEIAKLRLWLSLIVDEENIKYIKPLPNLDYKIMQGNSLIEYVTPESLAITNEPDRTKLIRSFNQSKQEYLSTYEPGQKKSKRDEINKLIEKIMIYDKKREIETDKAWKKFQEKQQGSLFGEDTKQLALGSMSEKEKGKIKQQEKEFNQLKSLSPIDHFEWHLNYNEVFDEKSGFDVVIANPPYIHIRTKSFDRGIIPSLKNRFSLAIGQFDFFVLFTELSETLLRSNGVYAFIIPKRVLSNQNYEPLRRFYVREMPINSYLDAKMPFEFANVEANVLIAQKLVEKQQNLVINGFIDNNILQKSRMDLSFAAKMPFFIFPFSLTKTEINLLLKIKKDCNKLSQFVNITRGYEFGFNHCSISKKHKLEGYKIIRGENISRYYIKFCGYYLNPKLIEKKNRKQSEIFTPPKLTTKFVSNNLVFAYDDVGYHNTNVVYNICIINKRIDLKLLLVLLNSTLMSFWFKKSFLNEDELFPHIQKNQLEEIPIKKISEEEQKLFIEIVDKILKITSAENYDPKNPPQEQKLLEVKIDQMVYKLYGLAPEEIEIVEQKTKI